MSRVESEPIPSYGGEERWRPRTRAALALKIAIVAVPLAASLLVSVTVAGLLPLPTSRLGELLWWVAILASSSLVLIAGEALARRALPLVGLWRLSLLFPGPAPSRVGIARSSSRRELERLSDQVRTHGLGPDAEEAAVTLVRLVGALDAHDRRTRGHSERVRVYTDLLAHRLHLDEDETNKLRWAALLHDIGKLSVPAEVLNKPGRLNEAEWALIHQHPAEGDRMLGALREWLGPWALVVLEHHERWDGAGYPAGLAAAEISYGARLVAVADCYDVMTSVRSYQPRPRTPEDARTELVRCSGSQFDPGMVRCFLNISTRRLWWLLGPVTWLVQVPLIGRALAATVRRPQPKLADVGQVALSGVAALMLATGFSVPNPGGLPPAAAEGASARERTGGQVGSAVLGAGADRSGTTSAGGATGVRHGPVTGAPPARPVAVVPPLTVPPRPVAPPVAPAAPAPPAPPAPPLAPPVGPPGGVPGAAPKPPAPPADPPGRGGSGADGDDSGDDKGEKGKGKGHEKGKGKGHEHHDADGDGVDDKAGR
jgi:hypothetical protein